MRLLLQRVKQAKVEVEGKVVGAIGPGLLVFLGIAKGDSAAQIPYLAKKLVEQRVFPDAADKMNLSVQESKGEILIVSQFTLYANCKSGRRPDFGPAMAGPEAEILYNQFVKQVSSLHSRVQTGVFGAYMAVSLVNDGPVTFLVEANSSIVPNF